MDQPYSSSWLQVAGSRAVPTPRRGTRSARALLPSGHFLRQDPSDTTQDASYGKENREISGVIIEMRAGEVCSYRGFYGNPLRDRCSPAKVKVVPCGCEMMSGRAMVE